MDPNQKKERQTAIMDDADALDLSFAQAQRGGKRGGRPKQGFTFCGKPQNAGISKSKPAAQKNQNTKAKPAPKPAAAPQGPRFYEENGLKIPLYDARGVKKTHARDGSSLAKKLSKAEMLNIVRQYAGEGRLKDFEDANKNQIGYWIQSVETKAFGNGPKIHQKANRGEVVDRAETPKQQQADDKAVRDEQANLDTAPKTPFGGGKRKRDDAQHATTTTLPKQTPKKLKTQHLEAEDSDADAATEPSFSPQMEKAFLETRRRDREEARQRRVNKPTAQPRAAAQPTPTAREHSTQEQTARPAYSRPGASPLEAQQPETQRISSPQPLPSKKFENHHLLREHPMIPSLGLELPKYRDREGKEFLIHWPPIPESTQVLNAPSRNLNVVITASSETAVHETVIPDGTPQSGRRPASPSEPPFLKPGQHGYDFERSVWRFAGDPDLETGRGHQVEPKDREKLEKDPGYTQWFKDKYPGYRMNQWPCGCEMPWNDEDSEAE